MRADAPRYAIAGPSVTLPEWSARFDDWRARSSPTLPDGRVSFRAWPPRSAWPAIRRPARPAGRPDGRRRPLAGVARGARPCPDRARGPRPRRRGPPPRRDRPRAVLEPPRRDRLAVAPPAAFDRRLTEALALFAGLDRIPHVWPMPGFDEPADLTARLLANGFEDHGGGHPDGARPGASARPARSGRGDAGSRSSGSIGCPGAAADAATGRSRRSSSTSFAVEPERGWRSSSRRSWAWRPTPTTRSSSGSTACRRRSPGGRRSPGPRTSRRSGPTRRSAAAGSAGSSRASRVADALADGSRWTYLGVFEENAVARRMYGSLGFVAIGGVAPDLLLRR